MDLKIVILLFVWLTLLGCKSTANQVESVSPQCPEQVTKFRTGNDDSEFVKKCLGKPNNMNQNPDGRYVYMYYRPKGVVLTYLFDKKDKLIRFRAYQDSSVN